MNEFLPTVETGLAPFDVTPLFVAKFQVVRKGQADKTEVVYMAQIATLPKTCSPQNGYFTNSR